MTPLRSGIGGSRRFPLRGTISPVLGRLVPAILLALLVALALPPPASALTPLQGDPILNVVTVITSSVPPVTATSTVRTIIPTPATIEFLQYAPNLPGAIPTTVVPGVYRAGADPATPFTPLPLPRLAGASSPLDLSQPLPLAPASLIHQGDPTFLRVTDLDQNMDRTMAETIFVTITNPATGDIEVILLTETGPDTGVFVGYLPTVRGTATLYDGTMAVTEGNLLSARYVDPDDGTDTVATSIMVDPYGLFLDSRTGLPVSGATITLIDMATGTEAHVYGDDGASTYPATLTSGGTATDSSGRLYIFQPGGYRFPFVNPGTYRYRITPPAGYAAPSTVDTSVIQALPGGPFAIFTGSRGEIFSVNPGPALRIDIPLDPAATTLWVQKSAGKELVAQGDFLPYQVTIANTSTIAAAGGVRATDTLPVGFRLRSGSVLVDNAPAADPAISGDGRTLTFSIGTLGPGVSSTIQYVAEVTAGARIGTATNTATATTASGGTANLARATVLVRDDFLRNRSVLMGRVTTGACSAETGDGASGMEGIRIYLEDGSFVVSDRQGLFHFEGIRPGLHVVQLDLDSLPAGYEALPCTENSRFAGRAFSQFAEVQGGTLWRTDFHVGPKAPLRPVKKATPAPVQPVVEPPRGLIALELASTPEGESIAYRATMRGGTVPVQAARLNLLLPEGVTYLPGSSSLDTVPIADPIRQGEALVYRLGDLPANWHHQITFRGIQSDGSSAGKKVTRAYLAADGPTGASVLTPPAETVLQLVREEELQRAPDIVMHPHFPTFGAELDNKDREMLDRLADLLIGLRTETIHVTGHTDNVRIAPRSRSIYQDNEALSLARARSVGRYLMERLHFAPEKLSLDGRGETLPVASNRSAAGRALNRRVEVRITTNRVIERSQLNALQAASGLQQAETVGIVEPPAPVVAAGESTISSPAEQTASETAAEPAAAETGAAAAPAAPVTVVPVGTAVPTPPANPENTQLARKTGILNLPDGELLINRMNTVQVRIDTALTPKLLLDGKEVSSEQIGFRSQDPATGKTFYSYIGVDFGPAGDHTLTLQGVDPFGNPRHNESVRLTRTGEVAAIRLISAEGNVADGITPVRMQLELLDASGHKLRAATDLELRDGSLRPLASDARNLEDKTAGRRLPMDRDGWISFQPVTTSGPYRVVIGHKEVSVEAETYVQPKLRDWILVGLAEGTVGYNVASGNMENLQAADADEELYKDGRIALFAKGRIKGKWLMTISYDSAKSRNDSGNTLFQTINPDAYYTLYGDAGQRTYDAASTGRLYIKVEREQFYAMFGDFDTDMTVTELSRYSRRMNGAKTELQTRNMEINAFASETDQAYVRDELPGDGTSGLYRLSRHPLLANSEKITIEVRDRFRSEVIISSRTLGRFTDYSIDYDAGTIFFKEPVQSRDQQFNPVTIVVEYETLPGTAKDYTYGGRAGVKLLDQRVKAGVSYIHEGQNERKSNLYGVDASIRLGEATRLRAEFATSDYRAGSDSRTGTAYLTELAHTGTAFDARLYLREQKAGFGLGQQPGSEAGTRKVGLEGTYRLSERLSTTGNAYRQYNLLNSAERDVAEAKLNYNTARYGASFGLLHASDRLADGSSRNSGQMTLGGRVLTLGERLTLTIDHAQSVWGDGNVDFPTRTSLGAEFKLHRDVTLLAAQEFTWGDTATTANTRLGVRSTPWKGATVNSSVERQFNENEERVFANVGLRQSWQVSETWKVDGGVDRSQTIAHAANYRFSTSVPPASGGTENFTAISTGATYQVKGLTWDNRLELRLATNEDKWGLMSGLVNEVDGSSAWSGRLQLFQTFSATGIDTTKANARFGLVHRPAQTRWLALNRLDFMMDRQSGASNAQFTSWRIVNNLSLNYRPRKQLQVSLQYGAKFVHDTISGQSYNSFTDHIGAEGRYDITRKWDFGFRASLLHSWHGGQLAYSFGPALGYNVVDNAWVGLGYNLWGFDDKDFSSATYTAQGPYVRFRMKFDQQSVKDAADWINKQ